MVTRSILITGGNGGLGRAIAAAFLDECDANFVWLGVRANRDQAEALVASSRGRCKLVELDVTDTLAWSEALEVILDDGGRIGLGLLIVVQGFKTSR